MVIVTIKIRVILSVSDNEIVDCSRLRCCQILGRSRWVEYADRVGLDYDASQVPPEWWLFV